MEQSDMPGDKRARHSRERDNLTPVSRRATRSQAKGSTSAAVSVTVSQKRDAAALNASKDASQTRAKKPRVDNTNKERIQLTPRSKSTVAITPISALPRNQSKPTVTTKDEELRDQPKSSSGRPVLKSKLLTSIDLPPTVPNLFSSPQGFTPCQCMVQQCTGSCTSVDYLNTYGWEHKTLLKEKESMEYFFLEDDTDPLELLTQSYIVPPKDKRTRKQTEWFCADSINWDLEDYMARQGDLNAKMRGILVDWIVELSEEYKLSSTTFHLAVTLIDKSLACTPVDTEGAADNQEAFIVTRDKLQCLGCACTLIACKLEESVVPSVDDFVYISDHIYRREQITDMETDVCVALKFRLQHLTPVHYAHEFLLASEAGPCSPNMPTGPAFHPILRNMIYYLLEVSRLSYELIAVKPSLVAAAAVFLARATLGIRETEPSKKADCRGFWTNTLQHYSGYTVEELHGSVRILLSYQREAEASNLKAVFTKYSKAKYMHVSMKTVLNHQDLGLECFFSYYQ